MTRHVSIENLARFRGGDLRGRRARRVAAHLAGCTRCQQASAALAEVPALLAAADLPQIPAHLAARIETALATESAHRAAAAPSIRASRPGHASHRQRSARRSPWLVPAARVLAATAAVVVVGGGGYELVSHLGGASSGTSAASSATGARHSAALKPEAAPPASAAARGTPLFSPLRYRGAAGHVATIRPVRTGTDYQLAQLAGQAAAAMSQISGTTPLGIRAGPNMTTVPSAQSARLSACVSRVAAGRTVLLVDIARFGGTPATVIVTAARGAGAEQVWVVGQGCSASGSDVLAHRPLPRG